MRAERQSAERAAIAALYDSQKGANLSPREPLLRRNRIAALQLNKKVYGDIVARTAHAIVVNQRRK